MARITPIDVIQGISGKYGSGSSDYFATNSSSNKIHLAKYKNKYTGPYTQDQQDQMEKFGTQAKLASAWLRANRPTDLKAEKDTREHDGTDAYQEAMALKKSMHLSNIRQVVVKYMDEQGNVTLPSGDSGDEGNVPSGGGGTVTKYTLSLAASPTAGGTVSGAGQYNSGASASINAVANSGYTFTRWSDGVTSASRSIVMTGNKTLSAIFTATDAGEVVNPGGDEGEENNLH